MWSLYIRYHRDQFVFDRMQFINQMRPEHQAKEAIAEFDTAVQVRAFDVTRIVLIHDETIIREWSKEED